MQQDSSQEQLHREKLRADYGSFSNYGLVVFIAHHADGTPARGTIACDGLWFKYGDGDDNDIERKLEWALPFKTDSLGRAIFNPSILDTSGWACEAVDHHGHRGWYRGDAYDTNIIHIEVE